MRILHLLDHSIPLQSGYTFRTLSILRSQRERGWETYHITGGKHGDIASSCEEVDGLKFYRTNPSSGLLARLPVINQLVTSNDLYSRVCEVIEEVRPDILHAHSPSLNGLAALRAGSQFGIPVVYEIRAFWEDAAVDHGTSSEGGVRYRLTKSLETYVARRADWVTVICEGLRNDLAKRGIDEERITIIPNAVDADKFEFGNARDSALENQYKLQGKSVIGFIGSFYAYEGISDLVNVMPAVLAKNADARLLLVGGGPCFDEVKKQIADRDLSDYVIVTGRVPHNEVQRYYSLVDVFCYPRVSMRLTDLVTPLKPLEAMAQGKLVIASNVGGHRELIEDGKNGYLYKAGDEAALAETILGAFENRKDWPQMRASGRAYVENERNWTNSIAQYAPIYDCIVQA